MAVQICPCAVVWFCTIFINNEDFKFCGYVSIRARLKTEMLAALSRKSGWYFGNLFLDKIYKVLFEYI
jgi:hypothetical protein